MRIVSENSREDLAKRESERALGYELREMAANLLRVIRGAGRPYDVGRNMVDCIRSFEAYREAVGHYPMSETISRMLDPDRPWPRPEGDDQRESPWTRDLDKPGELVAMKREYEEEMRRASLQITASVLIGQLTQQRRGESDLRDAIRSHERTSRELSAYWDAQRAASLPVKRGSARKTSSSKAKAPQVVRQRSIPAPIAAVPAELPRPAPKPKPAVDPFKPPPYEVRHSFPLPEDLRTEFGVATVLGLVSLLNDAWKAQGRRPLAQGSFPRNATGLAFVAKELRLARSSQPTVRRLPDGAGPEIPD